MKDLEAKRRERLKLFIDSFGRRKLNWVAKQCRPKVSESTLRQYLKGTSSYLEEPTYDKLARWSGWTVAELKGEEPAPSSEVLMSRKSGTPREQGNDFLSHVGKTHNGAVGTPESEGDVPDRLFIEILDKIEALPPGHLHRLRLLIDRLDAGGAAEARPPKAGVAE
jgi:hypothetical protein